jgi:hypothetical protein
MSGVPHGVSMLLFELLIAEQLRPRAQIMELYLIDREASLYNAHVLYSTNSSV